MIRARIWHAGSFHVHKVYKNGQISRKRDVNKMAKKRRNTQKEPVAHAEDVEFSRELADEDDREAQERARNADKRAKS